MYSVLLFTKTNIGLYYIHIEMYIMPKSSVCKFSAVKFNRNFDQT